MKFKRLAIGPLLAFTTFQYLKNDEPPPQQASLKGQVLPPFKKRAQHIEQISKNPNYDVVIIGGGCNGAGVMLDASTRGLRTLMIQKDDFGSGASSKSTKLIHGGVRYLQQVFGFDSSSLSSRLQKFSLVTQAITQRSNMIDSAPHLTKKIPFVIPCSNIFQAFYYYLGSIVYYAIYAICAPLTPTIFKFPHMINRMDLVDIFPHINPKYTGGVVYQDGSFNDSRYLLSVILTATTGNGISMPDSFVPANVLNRAQCLQLVKDKNNKITGVVFQDKLGNKRYRINAKYVVNCTGCWADNLRLKDNPVAKKRILPVAGSHLTYHTKVANPVYGLCAPSSDGRILLVVPWLNRIIAGTTQQPVKQVTNNPVCTDRQRKFITDNFSQIMSNLDAMTFMQSEKARWCGMRPLVVNDVQQNTKDIARTHIIQESDSGLLSLMGGKWTTFRKMGEDLVDKICQKQKENGKVYGSSQTAGLPLIGAAGEQYKVALFKQLSDVGVELYHTFGSLAMQVKKSGKLQKVYGSTTYAELEWIVKNQYVTDIEDVLLRRTRLCFLTSKQQALSLAETIGSIMQKQFGWSNKQTKKRVQESVQRILSYEFD